MSASQQPTNPFCRMSRYAPTSHVCLFVCIFVFFSPKRRRIGKSLFGEFWGSAGGGRAFLNRLSRAFSLFMGFDLFGRRLPVIGGQGKINGRLAKGFDGSLVWCLRWASTGNALSLSTPAAG